MEPKPITVYSCDKCEYKNIRWDNFNRHVKTHANIRLKCDCGAFLAETSMQKHFLSAKHIEAMKKIKNTDQDVEASKVSNENTIDEISVNIKTTIKIKTMPDGQLVIEQNPIKIGEMSFCLVPSRLLSPTNQS